MKKAFKIMSLTVALSVFVGGLSFTSANAGTDYANGGGVVNTTLFPNQFSWAGSSGSNTKTAWDFFKDSAYHGKGPRLNPAYTNTIDSQYNRLMFGDHRLINGGNAINIKNCEKSANIWWIAVNQSGADSMDGRGGYQAGDWIQMYNGDFASKPQFKNVIVRGNSPVSTDQAYDALIKAGVNKTGTSIVCSWGTGVDSKKVRQEIEEDLPETVESYDKTAVYAYYTDVTPHPIKNGGSPSPLEYQKGEIVKTNFGKALDEINKTQQSSTDSSGLTISQIKSKIESALAKDRVLGVQSSINLNSKNATGIQKGGILNFSEKAVIRSISAKIRKKNWHTKTCDITYVYNPATGKIDKEVSRVCSNTGYNKSWKIVESTLNKGLPVDREIGFKQLMSVVCNPGEVSELEGLVKRRGGTVERSGQYTRLWSKKYNSRPHTSDLDFGPSFSYSLYANGLNEETLMQDAYENMTNKNPNQSLRDLIIRTKTGYKGFYDKECPVECKPAQQVGSGTEILKDNSLFRDNKGVNLKLGYTIPVNGSNGLVYSGEKASTTTFVLWSFGTPGVKPGENDNGGRSEFKAVADDGTKTILFGGTSKPLTQKNWDKTTYVSERAHKLSGEIKSIEAGATWVSDTNKPQILNTRWEFVVQTPNRFATRYSWNRTGNFSDISSLVHNGGNFSESNYRSERTPVDVKCESVYDTSIEEPFSNDFERIARNTGTGSINKIDLDINTEDIESGGSLTEDDPTLLVIKFLRAVSG